MSTCRSRRARAWPSARRSTPRPASWPNCSPREPKRMDDDRHREGLAPRRSRRIYLLPNAFTTAALFCGFYAIVQAMNGRFEVAAIAIFVAMVLDSLDGRVARMTNTQSAFGEQYDSLSDM
ncbi:MAG: CDP-alcohol phosphatidyltransferase family protein, partial [Burkholderiaceae bacterium]|nr:CDP-alcohol phosphatidyltransferase family protein [Burkholderiaceae bacterium]